MYMGSNVIVHQIQNFPYLLYIKLHLNMPGNEQLQISSPPTNMLGTNRRRSPPKMVMTKMTTTTTMTLTTVTKMTNQPRTYVLLHRMALKRNIRGQWKAVHQLEDIIFLDNNCRV